MPQPEFLLIPVPDNSEVLIIVDDVDLTKCSNLTFLSEKS